jgi:putative membrane protein
VGSPEQPPEGNPPAVAEASRRTRLANERTYLAWWRTGLASVAVGIAVGRLVPLLSHGVKWPFTVAGAGFAAVGALFIALALVRNNQVERALARGEFAPPDDRLITALTLIGVLLGLLVMVLVVTSA